PRTRVIGRCLVGTSTPARPSAPLPPASWPRRPGSTSTTPSSSWGPGTRRAGTRVAATSPWPTAPTCRTGPPPRPPTTPPTPGGGWAPAACRAALPRRATAAAADDATDARWWPVDALADLAVAFDHRRIITRALASRRAARSTARGPVGVQAAVVADTTVVQTWTR